jgi:hypothetical protein
VTWLDIAIARFGDPAVAFPDPLIRFDLNRRCWVWSVDVENYNLALDVDSRSRVTLSVNGPSGSVKLYGAEDPADADIQAACACVWPGFVDTADERAAARRVES